jgi:hypothetical protein
MAGDGRALHTRSVKPIRSAETGKTCVVCLINPEVAGSNPAPATRVVQVRGPVAGDGGRVFGFVAARWQQDRAASSGRLRLEPGWIDSLPGVVHMLFLLSSGRAHREPNGAHVSPDGRDSRGTPEAGVGAAGAGRPGELLRIAAALGAYGQIRRAVRI